MAERRMLRGIIMPRYITDVARRRLWHNHRTSDTLSLSLSLLLLPLPLIRTYSVNVIRQTMTRRRNTSRLRGTSVLKINDMQCTRNNLSFRRLRRDEKDDRALPRDLLSAVVSRFRSETSFGSDNKRRSRIHYAHNPSSMQRKQGASIFIIRRFFFFFVYSRKWISLREDQTL